MGRTAANPRSALEMLPIEVKQAIMFALPDVRSLRSIALTSSSWYHAFTNTEVLITNQVLLNEVEFDVLPEAAIALESSRLKLWARQGIQDFVFQHLSHREPPPKKWTLSDALLISKLYGHVYYFAVDFTSKTLVRPPITKSEMTRIIRVFYRFEIYRNIFSNPKCMVNIQEQRDVFFSNFSPWENEQLVCIHDYLAQVVSPAFNDIAEHDIEWGEFSIEYDNGVSSQYIQHVLSLGLEHLHQIALAVTYEAIYKLLYSNYPKYNDDFLYEALERANKSDDGVYLSDYTQDEEFAHIKLPFAQESDTGPTDAWRWAHQAETCAYFLNSYSQKPLRKWGYVMWDRARLDKWDTLQTPWEASSTPVSTDEERQRFTEMLVSFDLRSEIYMAGGRGWWSLGDESKVVWLGDKLISRDSSIWKQMVAQSQVTASLTYPSQGSSTLS